ncbi:isochorismatase hydrolase [Pyrolobus fumarii 1A]|uniref:Isochorismatase hydrolase n=1 Tax=Pyrolobus fumarii (strain DSM 11204 / 1A) TaxID=694429 RepID=G0EH65_PYRF1|nr:isochorismatase family cysteine hydrolase [Pyrolobus fumarii]AEM39289.1 isochorismatase hydrolase [Pyrolobus fumarii 1A]
MKPALLVIDMLEVFVRGRLKAEGAENIIPVIARLREEFHKRGYPVIYTNDAHYPFDFEVKHWGPHAVRGSEEAQVVPELRPTEKDYVVLKRRYDAFFATDLDLLLRELGIDTVVLTGVATDICVLHTAAGAFFRGYKVIVVKDATAGVTKDRHNFALEYMRQVYGAEVLSSEELISKL